MERFEKVGNLATEWDMGWFCDKCEKLKHWKSKGYKLGKKIYCYDCAVKIAKGGK